MAADPIDLRLLVSRLIEAGINLDTVYRKLARQEGWSDDGWSRNAILDEIDPQFIHHAEHFHRLLFGGSREDGTKFPGGGGLQWVGLDVTEHAALLKVKGSFEWKTVQTVYEQSIGFANYLRIVEAPRLTWPQKAQLLLTRDGLRIHCTCEAYRFFHAHAATTKGFALVAEQRPAPTINPDERSGACKHLNVVLKWLGGQGSKLASEMKKKHGDG